MQEHEDAIRQGQKLGQTSPSRSESGGESSATAVGASCRSLVRASIGALLRYFVVCGSRRRAELGQIDLGRTSEIEYNEIGGELLTWKVILIMLSNPILQSKRPYKIMERNINDLKEDKLDQKTKCAMKRFKSNKNVIEIQEIVFCIVHLTLQQDGIPKRTSLFQRQLVLHPRFPHSHSLGKVVASRENADKELNGPVQDRWGPPPVGQIEIFPIITDIRGRQRSSKNGNDVNIPTQIQSGSILESKSL
ncbi:UDP-D-glucose/UDP-D-galactose 4-epimerase 3 [Striga asiatica]|uniref:UDP-D-glucose/UDP-D-galactose 4-epimerase 3 n=1 Tax=Striga asiatica TaxID=4170 RepID=A0A5A7P3E2_STRAF|nr:UDP-D-glucose/UDP-D-galactose 4-epimerase 3 [Striga asiatica]